MPAFRRFAVQMKTNSIEHSLTDSAFAVYDCEIHLKFRLIEDKHTLLDRDRLLEILLDALSYGADEYLEPVQSQVDVQELPEVEASPQMRRQLIRLRNSELA
ncbi:Npun_R1517 family heterocyst differentiation transcriptional regulator [Leptolyngbya ohadii]|uniref:Npun_R1517 family heterocyst differentiation transcriptional regulator n=1 Tax=Leptolyngbya ohadii TaxID=1962290 RepID=UPI0021F10977|nr:Npun_R1517 family heterocyst differentiation transcriptional regulator [Leptolyngbya ohadii]